MTILCWNDRGLGDSRAVHRLRMTIRDFAPRYLSENKLSGNKASATASFSNCIIVNSNGRSAGLGLFWSDSWNVVLQSCSPWHIDTIISFDSVSTWRFTGFYGHLDANQRILS